VQLLKYAQSGPTTTLPQRAIARFLEGGGYDRHLRTLRRRLAVSMHRVVGALGEYFPRGTRTTQPQGGMMVWVELPRKVKALELYQRALAEHIVIAPGPIFSARQGLTNFIRLNAAQDCDERVERALQRLGHLATELAETT
jgi:DNA-binding transcriptional MocR family regulator